MNAARRKKYLAVIAVCGVALLLDRFALPKPAPAQFQFDFGVSASASREPAGQRPVQAPLPVPEIPFPRNVQSLAPDAAIRDFFAMKDASPAVTHAARRTPDNEASNGLDAASFLAKHKLKGVMVDRQLRIAVLAVQWVEVGRQIDGCTLNSLFADRAVFTCFDGEAVLKLHGLP